MKKEKTKNSEFDLYDSIVNGKLRPFLPDYSSEAQIKKLIEKTTIIEKEYKFRNLDDFKSVLAEVTNENYDLKDGDRYQIEVVEKKDCTEFLISPLEAKELNELIDIDIPPPPDLKAEYFLDLIENEFEKIMRAAKKFINTSNEKEEISFYANQNIQIAKRIAADAHNLSKQLKSNEHDSFENSNTYIMYILKLFLKRAILNFQGLLEPFLGCTLWTEDEIRTQLYEQMPAQPRREKFERRCAERKKGENKEQLEPDENRHNGPNLKNERKPSETDNRHVFSLEGDIWKLIYNGDQTSLRNLERIRYIVHLIDNPNREFYSHQLTNLVKGNNQELQDLRAINTIDPINSNDEDENKFQKTTLDDPYELDIQPKELQPIRKIAMQLWEKLNDPELSANEKSKAQDDWAKAVNYFSSQYGIILKSKKDGIYLKVKKRLKKDYEKARTNVRKHIKNAIKDFDKKIPSLSKYLKNHIHTGNKCVYIPDPEDAFIWTVKWNR